MILATILKGMAAKNWTITPVLGAVFFIPHFFSNIINMG